jgi:chemotaxis protein MotB
LLKQTMDALEDAKRAAGQSQQDVLFGGLEQKLTDLAERVAQNNNQPSMGGDGQDGDQGSKQEQNQRAELAEDELKVALKQEIGEGLVAVERREDKVIVTVGSGGAFGSGSANLTPQARAIMSRIAKMNEQGNSRINVAGHTDNVPLIFGSQYRDNWDLAAARAASVVQAIQAGGSMNSDRLQAVSFGDARPVQPNDTADGRSKNRRIEIEINY